MKTEIQAATQGAVSVERTAELRTQRTTISQILRKRPLGCSALSVMTSDQIAHSLSTLDELDRRGTYLQVKNTISLALSMKAATQLSKTQLEVWVRKLMPLPFAAIVEVADQIIETPGAFSGDVGTVLHMVKRKVEANDSLRKALTFKPVEVKPVERSEPPELGSFPKPNARQFQEPRLKSKDPAEIARMKAKILGGNKSINSGE